MDEELYKENILEHYRNPHHREVLDVYDMRGEGANTTCGDEVELYLKFGDDGRVLGVGFLGTGCAVSQAAASMLTDRVLGMSTDELKLLSPGDIYTMLGIQISPARVNCALLGYEALQSILKKPLPNKEALCLH